MTSWLAHIPYLPTWTGWDTMRQLAEGTQTW